MLLREDDFWKPVLTTRQILNGEDFIAVVVYDEEGDWQALGAADFTDDDIDVVSVEEILALDDSLTTLPDMQLGEVVERDSVVSPWTTA